MDGTLLDDQKRLSVEDENALRRCIESGIEIVPCTGRLWKGIPEAVRNIPGIRYGITVNGAVVVDTVSGKEIQRCCLSHSLTKELIALARSYECMYDFYSGNQGYGLEEFLSLFDFFQIEKEMRKTIIETRKWIPDLGSYIEENRIEAEKINNFFRNQEERQRIYAMLKLRDDIAVTTSLANNIEINARNATKGLGINALATHLNIPMEQTMGIGDGENDFSMMQEVGVSVAMGNAVDMIKNCVDYVTDDNNHSGVAKAIERLIWKDTK